MVNYSTLDLLPGGTLQHLVFFESVPDQDIEISLQTVLKDTAGNRLNAKYPADLVDLGKLGDKLKKDRLDLNKIYLSEVPDEEDLSLTGQTLEFSMAEFIIREIKQYLMILLADGTSSLHIPTDSNLPRKKTRGKKIIWMSRSRPSNMA